MLKCQFIGFFSGAGARSHEVRKQVSEDFCTMSIKWISTPKL